MAATEDADADGNFSCDKDFGATEDNLIDAGVPTFPKQELKVKPER